MIVQSGVRFPVAESSYPSTRFLPYCDQVPSSLAATSFSISVRNNAALSSRRLSKICHLVPSSLDFAFCGLKSVRVALLPRPLAARALRARRLVPILADWRLPDRLLYAVYPDARFIPPRVRSVIALIEARLPELAVGS